jgi:hypothetical protein
MKKFRLLGLAAVLAFTFFSQVKPVFAGCVTYCTSNLQCQQCVGDPGAFCSGHHCGF